MFGSYFFFTRSSQEVSRKEIGRACQSKNKHGEKFRLFKLSNSKLFLNEALNQRRLCCILSCHLQSVLLTGITDSFPLPAAKPLISLVNHSFKGKPLNVKESNNLTAKYYNIRQ